MMSLLALSKYIITMLITEHKMTLYNSSGPWYRGGSYLFIFTRNGSIIGSRKKHGPAWNLGFSPTVWFICNNPRVQGIQIDFMHAVTGWGG